MVETKQILEFRKHFRNLDLIVSYRRFSAGFCQQMALQKSDCLWRRHGGKGKLAAHRHQLLDAQVVLQRSVASVAPGLGVDGHAVLPLVLQQVSGLVAVGAGVVPAVSADGAAAPAVVCHHRVSYRTVGNQFGLYTTGRQGALSHRKSVPESV